MTACCPPGIRGAGRALGLEGDRSVHSDEPPTIDENSGLGGLGFSSQPGDDQVPPPLITRPQPRRRNLRSRVSGSDLIFRGVLRGGGAWVLVLMVLVGAFLAYRASQALH